MLYKDFQLRLSMAMYSWKLGTSLFNHPAELLPNTSTRTLTYFLCIEPRIIIKPETTIADQSLSDCLRPLTVKKIMLNIVLRWFDNNCCNWASVWIFFICILNFFFYSIYFHLRWHVSCVVIYDLLQNYPFQTFLITFTQFELNPFILNVFLRSQVRDCSELRKSKNV